MAAPTTSVKQNESDQKLIKVFAEKYLKYVAVLITFPFLFSSNDRWVVFFYVAIVQLLEGAI